VPLADGQADYSLRDQEAPYLKTGIRFGNSIPKAAKIMLATTLLYLIIQVPATMQEHKGLETEAQAAEENTPALIGLFACVFSFFGYLWYCYVDANTDKLLAQLIKGIKHKEINIAAALEIINGIRKTDEKSTELLNHARKALRQVCKPFFKVYDIDGNGVLTQEELKPLLRDLGMNPLDHEVQNFVKQMDTDGDGNVNFEEFTTYLHDFMMDNTRMEAAPKKQSIVITHEAPEGDDGEEDLMPEEWADLDKNTQIRNAMKRSMWMMALGTFVVLVFSDPMVDCLNEWGNRLGVSAFYVSFIVAPFASNASELLAAYTYAVKRSERSITTALSTLIGAACMNNTFVLAIFLALVYVQKLAWQFTAETIATVVIQWVIGLAAWKCKTHSTGMSIIILSCYPGCLFLVYFLENVVGLD